jgi:hypothetical protein
MVRPPTPVVAALGLGAATLDGVRRLPGLLHDRYEYLARHGQEVLSGPRPTPVPLFDEPVEVEVVELVEPETSPPAPTPPLGRTEPVELPEDVLDDVAQLTPGDELAHADLPLADFDHLTVPQLRGRLRTLDLPQLVQLRDYEQAHAARLPVLTLLDNRIAKLVEDGQ